MYNAILCILVVCIITSCNNTNHNDFRGPVAYDFANPVTITLPTALDEISGLCFNKNNELFAIEDEHFSIYKLNNNGKIQEKMGTGAKGDFEEIAMNMATGIFYILRSNGNILGYAHDSLYTVYNALPKNEYESATYNENENTLVSIAKTKDNKKTLFKIPLDTSNTSAIAIQSFSEKDIQAFLKTKSNISCKPSGIAYNKIFKQYFLVSAIDKLLVILNNEGQFQEAYALNPALFQQPEGIAFDKDNNLYISNEKNNRTNATIIKYNLKNK